MKTRMIETTYKKTDMIASSLAAGFNAEGYMTMVEAIPGGRKVKITKGGAVRTVTGLATCVDVDITTTDGGLLVTYAPSVFKQNAAALIVSMMFFWPVLIPQVIGWIERSGLGEDIFSRVESICRTHTAIEAA